MSDISNYDERQNKIFNTILEFGQPKTTYDLMKKGWKIATIHRHIKEMLDQAEIKIYSEDKKGRKKIQYGPTIMGLWRFYNVNNYVQKNIEQIFINWKDVDKFKEELKEISFSEELLENTKSQKIFKDLIFFNAGTEKAYEDLANDPYEIPYESMIFIGGYLLASKKEYVNARNNMVKNLPLFQKAMTNIYKNITKQYNAFKEKS